MSGARNARTIILAAMALLPVMTLPAAATAAVSNRALVELTDMSSLSISPDGRFVVFRTEQGDIVRNSYVLRWHSVDLQDGTVRDIGSGGDPIFLDPGSVQPERPAWVEGDHAIVFRALVDGAVGLWRADVAGGSTGPLVVRDADIEDYSASEDGKAILYRVGPSRDETARAEQREYDAGILVDATVDLSQNLFRGGSINGRMATQRLVGTWFIKDGLLWRSPRQKRRLDLTTGRDEAVGEPDAVSPITLPSAPPPLESRNSKGEVASASWDGKQAQIRAELSGGGRVACTSAQCASLKVSSLVWRPASEDVLITAIDRERRQSLYLWNTRANALQLLTKAEGLLSGGRRNMVPCAVSTAAAVCVAASAASPPRLERIDLTSGERTVLFDPNATMRAAYHPDVRLLRWRFGAGGEATGVLMQSTSAAGRAPLYLNYYLCEGFLRGGEGDEWPIPALLDAGFAVACVNSVPSPGPQDAVADDRTALAAITALVGKLDSEGRIDRSKIAMGGLSHGSEIALWVASHSDLLSAVSISSGQLEPANYWSGAVPGSDQPYFFEKVWGLGDPDRTAAQWRLLSPARRTDRIDAPVLFQLPELEARRIPELYARLARRGTPTELYAFPDEMHLKVQPRHRLAVYDRNLDWFRYWLQDARDPDPDKLEQYRRWDALRVKWKSGARAQARQPR